VATLAGPDQLSTSSPGTGPRTESCDAVHAVSRWGACVYTRLVHAPIYD